jgi:hypothetical protein
MSVFVLSQILASIAIVFDLFSFQFKNRQYILLCFISASILLSMHFILLEKWTAAALMVIAIFRFTASYYTTSVKVRNLFIVLNILVCISTYQDYLSVLSCLAATLGTIGSFQKDDKRLREFMIVGTSLWVVHNALALTPMGTLIEMLFLGSNLTGYYRFYIKKKNP